MPDPKQQLISFPLDLGMDVNSDPENVQPFGERPRLVASYNTRLTKVRGRVCKSPGVSVLASSLNRCGGIVPCGGFDSKVAFFHPGDGGNRRIAGGAVGKLTALHDVTNQQNAFYPLRVARAGALPAGSTSFQTPAVAHDSDTGYTYYASLGKTGGGATAIYVTVLGEDGELICSPTQLVVYGSAIANPFVAITAHPSVVRLWYKSTASNAILCAAVTISALTVAIGAPSTIFTPSAISVGSAALAYDQEDTTGVYVICFTAAGNNARLMRVNPSTMTVTTGLDVATGANATAKHAIAYVHDGTSGKLSWMVSWDAGNCSLFEANTSTLATVWSQTNRMWWANGGSVSCGFFRVSLPLNTFQCVFGVSREGTVASTATPAGTKFEFRAVTTGALLAAVDLPWHQMVSQICTHKVEAAAQFYPLIAVAPLYAIATRYDPTSVEFISDPSIEVFRPRYDSASVAVYWDPVARVGSDIAVRYPSFSSAGGIGGCNSFIQVGDANKFVYLSENLAEGATLQGYVPRYVDLDWSLGAPRFAVLSSGQAVIAGALPAVWDGSEITEFQPTRAPKMWGSAVGGSGSNLTGTYLFAAVVSWKDSAGFLHRGPPSNVVTLAPAGTPVQLWVTKPVGYRNGASQGPVTVTIYASQAGDTTLYAQITTEVVASSTAFWLAFTSISTPVQNALTPALYSTGDTIEMKIPYHPNACLDVKVIGDRLWILDAERRRAYYSQPLSTEALAGVFPAINPTQYVDFPAAAGKLVALENWHEQPRFHTGSGVWTIDGDGPDALNNPPFFAQPRQLSDYPCTDAGSVALTPVGVVFRSSNRFALAGDGFGLLDDMNADTEIVGVAVFRDQHEVVIFSEQGGCYVFNLLKQAWTLWDNGTLQASGSVTCAVQDTWTGKVFYYSAALARLMEMDPATVSATAQISIETGRVLPGGPQEDSTLVNFMVRAAKAGTHGVELRVGTDYQALQPVKAYSSGDVDAAVQNGRYDLWPEPRDMPARAVVISIIETGAAGEGLQPINATLEVLRNAGKRAQSLRQTGRK